MRADAAGLANFWGDEPVAQRAEKFCKACVRLLGLIALVAAVLPARSEEFEFLHLWLTQSERRAMSVLQQAIEREGFLWREHPVDGNFTGVKAKFSERFALGRPPTAMFWIGGKSLEKFVDDGLFLAIEDPPGRPKLADRILPEVLELVGYRGRYGALPVVIHLQNFAIFNRSILDKLSLRVPQSWQEFLDNAPTILKAGYAPLSMSDERWQLRFLFTSILAEQLEADEVAALFEHAASSSEPIKAKLRRALYIIEKLRPFVNADYKDLNWEKTALAVANDKAVAVVGGDFLAPIFPADGRFQCGLSPGSKFLMWSLDVVAFPVTGRASQRAAQQVAMRAWSQPDVLDNFASKKGGVSVIAGSNSSLMNDCVGQSARAWNSGAPRIPVVSDLWSNQLNRLSSVVGEYWGGRTKSIDDVVDLMLVALKAR